MSLQETIRTITTPCITIVTDPGPSLMAVTGNYGFTKGPGLAGNYG